MYIKIFCTIKTRMGRPNFAITKTQVHESRILHSKKRLRPKLGIRALLELRRNLARLAREALAAIRAEG